MIRSDDDDDDHVFVNNRNPNDDDPSQNVVVVGDLVVANDPDTNDTTTNTSEIMINEEQVLLESMNAYIVEQNRYEHDVIQQLQQVTPTATTIPQLLPHLLDITTTTTKTTTNNINNNNNNNKKLPIDTNRNPSNKTDNTIVLQQGLPTVMIQELLRPFHRINETKQPSRKLKKKETRVVYPKKQQQQQQQQQHHQTIEEVGGAINVIQSLLEKNTTTPHAIPPAQQQQQQPTTKREELVQFMKQQILLHIMSDMKGGTILTSSMLHNNNTSATMRTKLEQQPDDVPRKNRRVAFALPNVKKLHDKNDDDTDTLVQQQDSNKPRMPTRTMKRRIPIMKRKRNASGASTGIDTAHDDDYDYETDDVRITKPAAKSAAATTTTTTTRSVEELKALRNQRVQRRQQLYERHNNIITIDDDESEQEMELDDNHENRGKEGHEEHTSIITDIDHKEESSTEAEAEIDTKPPSRSVSCPICQQSLFVDKEQDTDTILAFHMSECQEGTYHTRSKRPRRQQQSVVNYDDDTVDDVVDMSTDYDENAIKPAKRTEKKKASRMFKTSNISVVAPKRAQAIDDMDENDYDDRVDEWVVNGLRRMKRMRERDPNELLPNEMQLDNQFYIPAWMNNHLFQYQRDGIEWLYQLHQQSVGGIIGDEMGLGKTVQVAAYIGAGISCRKIKSVLIVAPATILQHWLYELAIWAPGLRRILIHTSGGSLDRFDRSLSRTLLNSLSKWLRKSRSHRVNEPIDDEDWDTMEPHSFCGTGYAIVTTYENLRRNAELYASHDWSYVVLDEAQKIRNPDADITLACKRIRTSHRLAMSGTPIQNDLRELWSLFDFVFPGRLGTLPSFEQEFALPIKQGGYSNASPMQVQLAYRCAITLRDMIEPYLLRRLKKDVKEVSRMPGKTEHVLFCRLSTRQRAMYEAYLQSDDVLRVFRGNHMLLAAVTVLRKICNHPDLVCDPSDSALDSFIKNRGNIRQLDDNDDSTSEGSDFDYAFDEQSLLERSGKLDVLSKILPIWQKQGHRVLIFCQWRKMLNIIERFVQMNGWKFGRLDGNTNIASRQRLVDSFNTDESYFGMLCTTRTGGVGLNLIGANRIILYDPDWNPSGDAQARERAWRFGQEKEVTIYRLITAGSIEEKIYQRQIFKTAMTNKVLQDPKQRRLFSQRDLKDLFSLSADNGSVRSGGDGMTATSAITNGVGVVDRADLTLNNDDNDVALKKLMNSKGLAGVFDHHSIEPDVKRKSITVREMEEKAKQIASEAAKALRESVITNDPFTPTWTGSEETKSTGIFGLNRGGTGTPLSSFGISSGPASSASLLATIRQRNSEIETVGKCKVADDPATQKYTKLLASLKEFVQRNRPSTEDILKEYDDIPNTDVAIFRRLLKSVATMENGRWYINNSF